MPFYYDFNRPHDNAYLRFVRRIYRPLGFQKGYNFPLWVIMGGALFGFGLSRMMYFDIDGTFARAKVISGDWEYFRAGHYRVGIILHLAAILPACLLVPWQFLPVIRHKFMLFHRLNGYLNALLLLVGNAGAFMIARHSMNGELIAQLLIGTLGFLTTTSLLLAYVNIKRLQIDQHRAWMLRAWIIAGSIITLRIVQIPIMDGLSSMGDYYISVACHSVSFIGDFFHIPSKAVFAPYPTCQANPATAWAAVHADYHAKNPEEISAAVALSFGPAGFVALVLHVIGVELYLRLTPAEGERLKRVSYERQLARGMRNPGNASGLTVDVWGDAETWQPKPGAVGGRMAGDGTESDGSEGDMVKTGETGDARFV